MRLAGQMLALASLSALAGITVHPGTAVSRRRKEPSDPSPFDGFASSLDPAGATEPLLSRRRRRRLRGKRSA